MAIKYTTPEVAKNTTSRDIEALAAQECKLQEKSVEYTQNAEFVVTPDEGYDGMSKVNVSVDVVVPTVQATKEITITSNGLIDILPDPDYDVMEKVSAQINVPVPTPTLQEKHITIDKNLSMTEVKPDAGYQGLSSIEVDVEIPVEEHREVTITENGTTMIHPADGYDYMEFIDVTVNVTNPMNTYDVTQAVVNLSRFSGTSVPANVVGWENLVNGSYKCDHSNLTEFNIELPNLEDATGMFFDCLQLQTFSISLPKLKYANLMFNIDQFSTPTLHTITLDAPNLLSASNMIYSINLTDAVLNIPSYTNTEGAYDCMFYNCSNLTNLTINGELKAGLYLAKSNSLTVDSLMSVINALVTLPEGTTKTLTLGATNLAKLSEEQKAIATNKNWVLA